jgi:histidinol-phosphate aminotransferase
MDPSELKRLNISPDALIDFSVNSNPFGPSPRVLEDLRQVDVAKYPDRFCAQLKNRLAILNEIEDPGILVGNGTSELIWLVTQALLKPGEKVLILGPTFGEYRRAAVNLGGQVEEINAKPPYFRPPVEILIENIRKSAPRLVFLCNPNNPTGQLISEDDLLRILHACTGETILVIDEAYRAFAGKGFFEAVPGGNCIVLRSMTKDFALAGLRLGYLITSSHLVEQISRLQPAWSVNACAQAAGVAALADLPYYAKTLQDLNLLRQTFFAQIETITQTPMTSSTHFGVIKTPGLARRIRNTLLQQSIQVRDCASFGLPEYIRISTQLPAQNAAFLTGLKELFNSGSDCENNILQNMRVDI